MSELCWKVVRGKVVRVTTVNACGAFPAALTPLSNAVSDGFIQVSYAAVWESGDDFVQKNADGSLCVNSKSPDQFKRYDIKVQFCGVDPELLNLMTNSPLELDSRGMSVGFRYGEDISVADFALETWSGVPGTTCTRLDEQQTLAEGGSGLTSYTITWNGDTTASIDDDATADQVKAAMVAAGMGTTDDFIVTSGPLATAPILVTFVGAYAGANQPAMTTTPTGGTGVVTVTTVTVGGTAGSPQYGYFLLPHVTNGRLMDWTISNGVATFEVAGYTDGNTAWARGPYNVVTNATGVGQTSLDDPVLRGDHVVARVTNVAPPASFCGIQAMPAAPNAPA